MIYRTHACKTLRECCCVYDIVKPDVVVVVVVYIDSFDLELNLVLLLFYSIVDLLSWLY